MTKARCLLGQPLPQVCFHLLLVPSSSSGMLTYGLLMFSCQPGNLTAVLELQA